MNIPLNSPLSPDNAARVARANQLRDRAETVLTTLEQGPSEQVQLSTRDSNEGLGIYAYQGKIGPEQFASAQVSREDNQIVAFAAHDPKAQPGETVKFHLTSAKAQGMRAGLAAGCGAVAGALGNASAYLLAKAITTYPQHKITGKVLELASYPLGTASDLAHLAENKLAYTSEKDRYFAVSRADGTYEQATFKNDNTLDYDLFPAQPK